MSAAVGRAAHLDEEVTIPRRPQMYAQRTPWWRPRSTFGRILLGTVAALVIAAVVSIGILVRQFLTRDRHFRIAGASSIHSTGLSEVNRAEVLPVFGEDIGRNIFFVPLAERRHQLEAIPWVRQATVMRVLPNQISVTIVERTPVAFVRQGSQVQLADADGVILSMSPAMMAQHHYSFPVVAGIDAMDSAAARRTRMAVYQRFVTELDQNQQHLSSQVSEIDLSDPEDLRATMPEQGSDILAHFGEDQFLARLQLYRAHIAEWRQRYPRLIGVDLRYSGEVPLEMAPAVGGEAPAEEQRPAEVHAKAESKAAVAAPASANARKTAEAHRKAAARKTSSARSKSPAHKSAAHPQIHIAPALRGQQ